MVTILGHIFWHLPYKFTKFYKLLKPPIVKYAYSQFHFSYNGRFINLRSLVCVDDIFLNNDIVERRIYGACDVFIRDPILSSSSAFMFPFISLLPGRQHRRIRASRIIRILRHSEAWQRFVGLFDSMKFIIYTCFCSIFHLWPVGKKWRSDQNGGCHQPILFYPEWLFQWRH